MKVMLDASALIPAIWIQHPQHSACVTWLSAAASSRIELFIAAHTLAETYSVLTRLPTAQRIPPADAWHSIEASVLPHATIVGLTATDYQTILANLAQQGIGGGVIYDALVTVAAEKCAVDLLLTGNLPHFQRVWPGGLSRLGSPQTHQPPSQ